MNISFYVTGKVQAVMFRKTFCFGALKRGISAGATNDRLDKGKVLCSLRGDRQLVEEFLVELEKTNPLNSWGARVTSIERLEKFFSIESHEITSLTLEKKKLSKDVEFYL